MVHVWRSEQFVGVLSFRSVGPRDLAGVIGFGTKYLNLLSHLCLPCSVFDCLLLFLFGTEYHYVDQAGLRFPVVLLIAGIVGMAGLKPCFVLSLLRT